jgi:DNA-binding NarL/FixJ family response regulator
MIVDDHPMIRFGLRQLIAEESDLEVCGESENAVNVFPLIASTNPDLIVIDISLEDSNGLTLVLDIKKRYKSQKMLVYSMHDENLFALRAIQAGAMGYVNKNVRPTELIAAIQKVLRGGLAVSERVSDNLLATLAGTRMESGHDPMASLSNREIEVFEMLGRGITVREVAQRLGRSAKTIESHRERIMAKLGLENSAKLIRQAVEWVTEQDRIKNQHPD